MNIPSLGIIFLTIRIVSGQSCRKELDDYHICLKIALDKTRLNRTNIESEVKKCFQDGQCTEPNFDTLISTMSTADQSSAADRRLKQSVFKNIDYKTFEQCKITVNTKARDRIRSCVKNQISDFAPDIDEDINEDGEEDGVVVSSVVHGSYALSKLVDEPSICANSNNRTGVKKCISQAFIENQPAKNKLEQRKLFEDYCDSRDTCKNRLSAQCIQQLSDTHRLLCQCTISDILSSKSDDLRDEFLTCTKVDTDTKNSMSKLDANAHREYASASFCHGYIDPCNWLWRQYIDESINQSIDQSSGSGFGLHGTLQDLTFYENQTDGQLGDLLSGAFDSREIDRLRSALDTFSCPIDQSESSSDQSITSIIHKLIMNNTDIARVFEGGSRFFGYTGTENENDSLAMNITEIANRLFDTTVYETLRNALNDFMFPFGNSSMYNITTNGNAILSLVTNLRSQTEEQRLLKIIQEFQKPNPSSMNIAFQVQVSSSTDRSTSNAPDTSTTGGFKRRRPTPSF